ncbi:MAG TPA: hypothetical protein OIM45_06180 [Clostridiaceae bacterium]|nr:hypothetical protein [Clostridiaceae bacterium]
MEIKDEKTIPALKLYELIDRLGTIIDCFHALDLKQEKVTEIKIDITQIETAITNIEKLIGNDLTKKSETDEPSLELHKIINKIQALLDDCEALDLSYQKSNEISLNITRIESAITNVEALMECELKNKINEKAKNK